jgi:spore germination protein KB
MFKDKTIIQYSETIAGRIPGKLIGLIYCGFFIYIDAVILREFADFFTSVFFPETPLVFFSISIILASIYAVRQGLEVIARVNEIFFLY